jgi:hypothetical protein
MPIRLYPYTVRRDDTVTAISRRTGVPRAAIVGANQSRYGVSYVAGLGCCFQEQPTEGDTLYVPSLTKEMRDRIVSMAEDATIHDFRHRYSTLRYDESRTSQLGTVGMPSTDAMKAANDAYLAKSLPFDSQFPSDAPALVNAMASFWQYNPSSAADAAAPGAMDAPYATAQAWLTKAGGHATPDMTVIPWSQVDWSGVPWEIFSQPFAQTASFWQSLAAQYAGSMPDVSTGTVDLISGYNWFTSDWNNAAMPGTVFADRPWHDVPWTKVPWSAIPWREIPWSAIDWSKLTPDGAGIVDQIKNWYTNGTTKCSANGQVLAADGSCVKPGDGCGKDSLINAQGDCQCKDGFTWANPTALPGDAGFHDCVQKKETSTECRPPCGRGQRCVGGKCMPTNIFGGGGGQTLPPPPCPVGQHQADDGSCVPDATTTTCGNGEVLQNGKCVPVKTDSATETPKKSNTAMWVAGGVGVAALAGFWLLASKRKRREEG